MQAKRLLLLAVFLPLICIIMPANNANAGSGNLTVARNGTGEGYITAESGDHDGIKCGTDGTSNFTNCTEAYSYPLWFAPDISVIPHAITGSHFAGWSNNCSGTGSCTVDMINDRYVIATFNKDEYWITATAGSGGSIYVDEGQNPVDHGESVTFAIAPDTGYHLVKLTIDTTIIEYEYDPDNPVTVPSKHTFSNVTEDGHSIALEFALNDYTLNYSVATDAPGHIDGTSPQTVPYEQNGAQVEAVADEHYHFSAWSDELTANPRQDTLVRDDIDVVAHFSPDLFPITSTIYTDGVEGGNGGTISPPGNTDLVPYDTNVPYKGSQTYEGSVNEAYELDHIEVDSVDIGIIDPLQGSYTISNVGIGSDNDECNWSDGKCTIAAYFVSKTYNITTQAGANGTITLDPIISITHGSTPQYKVLADSGYHILSVTVEGVPEPVTGGVGEYIFTMDPVYSDLTIAATFARTYHTITAIETATDHGDIDPDEANVPDGDSRTFTITPDSGYYIEDVIVVDDIDVPSIDHSVGPVSSWEFTNVKTDASITAIYTQGFTIQTKVIDGTLSASGYTINTLGRLDLPGLANTHSPVFTFQATGGEELVSVLVDGVQYVVDCNNNSDGGQCSVDDGVYTFTFAPVSANHTFEVFFGTGHTVTVNYGSGGSITPDDNNYSPGSRVTHTVTPDAGYSITSLTVDYANDTLDAIPVLADCVESGSNNSCIYTIEAINDSLTLRAAFAQQFTISITAGANGDVREVADDPNTTVANSDDKVDSGVDKTYYFVPDPGYKIDSVLKDGIEQGTDPNITFTNVARHHTLSVEFIEDTYIIQTSTSGNGMITTPPDTDPVSGPVQVTNGETQGFHIQAIANHHIASIVVNGSEQPGPLSPYTSSMDYTFTPDGSGVYSIAVTFAPDIFTILPSIQTDATVDHSGYSDGGNGGSIIPDTEVEVIRGGSQTFRGTISEGYELTNIEVDGQSIGTIESTGSYTITNAGNGSVTDECVWDGENGDTECTIVAFFQIKTYDISTSYNPDHGEITIEESPVVHNGGTRYKVTPLQPGYEIATVSINGLAVASLPTTGEWVDLIDIQRDTVIAATFSRVSHDIYVNNEAANGTIIPSGGGDSLVSVFHGADQQFTIDEEPGYHVSEVTTYSDANGTEYHGSVTSYTFENVTTDNLEIYADFSEGVVISASTDGNGWITTDNPNEDFPDVVITDGGPKTFYFHPNTVPQKFHVADVIVDGFSRGAVESFTFDTVSIRHTIFVTFDKDYTISVSSEGAGTVDPAGPEVTATAEATKTFTFTPDNDNLVRAVFVDDILVGAPGSYTFPPVNSDHQLHVVFGDGTDTDYTITPSAGNGGSIAPDTPVSVSGGATYEFAVTPANGYAQGPVTGTCGGSLNTLTQPLPVFTTNEASRDCSVHATFVSDTDADNHYMVVPSVRDDIGGTINADTPQLVAEGGVISFILTPDTDANYTLGWVASTCGGNLNSEQTVFTTFAVTRNCSVEAIFVPSDGTHYGISSSAITAGGYINPTGYQEVAAGAVNTFTLHPLPGFTLGPVSGSCGGSLDTQAKTYTTFPANRPCTVEATFVSDDNRPYRITSSSGAGGTINVLGQQDAAEGEVLTFTLHPYSDYIIGPVTGTCGGSLNTQTNLFRTQPLTRDCTIVASFISTSEPNFTVTSEVLNNSGGTIIQLGDQSIDKGGVLSFTLHPAVNHAIGPVSGTCGGSLNVRTKTFTTLPVTQDCTVVASFVPTTDSFTVSASAGPGGYIIQAGDQPVFKGGVMNFAVIPAAGYTFGRVNGTCGGTLDTQMGSFLTHPVFSDCTVEATFVAVDGTGYTVVSSAGSGGTISPLGSRQLQEGEVKTYSLLPDPGYALGPVLGTCGGTLNTQTKTFSTFGISQDCTVEASFVDDSVPASRFTVTASAGTGGAIAPNGDQSVAPGGVTTFNLMPYQGYAIGPMAVESDSCPGTLNAQSKTFTTSGVVEDCTVKATFVYTYGLPVFSVKTNVIGNGTIAPAEQLVPLTSIGTFTLHPAPHHSIASVSSPGCEGIRSGRSYTTGKVLSNNCIVYPVFVHNEYRLTVTKTGNWDRGVIQSDRTPDLACFDEVCFQNYNDTVTLTAIPDNSVKFVRWTGCTEVIEDKCIVEMNGAQYVTAEFYAFPWHLFLPAMTKGLDR